MRLFPHIEQVFRIERCRTDSRGRTTTEVAYGVTSLRYEQADEAQILALVRGHWAIENSVHWVRDVTFREDASRIRTRHAPRVMATMRNLALSLLHRFAAGNVAHATRLIARDPERALALIGA